MAIYEIIEEFAEEAAFLYLLRNNAVRAQHLTLKDLARLDERLEAHIDGLRVAGAAAWDICKETFKNDDRGIFPAAVLAFEDGNETRIRGVMEAASRDLRKSPILISALGWLSQQQAEPHINRLLADPSSFHRYIGIAASAIHRRDPGTHLEKAACDPEPLLRARALRAYGELGRGRELDPGKLRDDLRADDDGIRFFAAWSAALAGNTETIEVLKSFVEAESLYQEKALNAVLRRMQLSAALSWQKHLAQSSDTIRQAVIGTGIIGDSVLIPWLIEQMEIPILARVAGEAFTMITGADIALEELKGAWPEGFEAGPSDDPADDNLEPDPDENLPWPSAALIAAWWHKKKGNYPSGIRYLLGEPVSEGHLRQVLITGYQKQRSAAALELAMMVPGQPLFEVRAPGFRQWLSS